MGGSIPLTGGSGLYKSASWAWICEMTQSEPEISKAVFLHGLFFKVLLEFCALVMVFFTVTEIKLEQMGIMES